MSTCVVLSDNLEIQITSFLSKSSIFNNVVTLLRRSDCQTDCGRDGMKGGEVVSGKNVLVGCSESYIQFKFCLKFRVIVGQFY